MPVGISRAAFDIRLQGTPAANRDAQIRLVNQATGQQVVRKPFLDGTLLVRDLDPGNWELEVTHPNLVQPIDRRMIRLFPQPFPTRVPVIVPPDLFRDTPIRDVPDADLSPVQQAASSARSAVAPLAGKAPGEVIRSSDWNALAGAVSDLAGAVLELVQLVSPQGHDHPEIAEKIAEVQGNVRRFAESFGRSLLELRRDIENQDLRDRVNRVIGVAEANTQGAFGERVLGKVTELEAALQQPTPVFTAKLATTGNVLLTEVNQLALRQPDPDAFLARTEVREVVGIAQHFAETGSQTKVEEELGTFRRTTSTVGGSRFGFALQR
jgi:hypothetical protein